MQHKLTIPLALALAGLLFAIIGVRMYRDQDLGDYAAVVLVLATGLVGLANGVGIRNRWRSEERDDRDPPP